MSRVVGAILALPLSQMLSDAVGTLFTGSSFTYTYSFTGALLWLVLSLVLATGASLWPAWNASRLTIRDVLAFA
jgi:putative ABC transport system permease protein